MNIPVRICHGQDVEVVEVEDVGVEVGVDDQLAHDEGGRGRRDPLTGVDTCEMRSLIFILVNYVQQNDLRTIFLESKY